MLSCIILEGCCRSCTKTALRMGLALRMALQCLEISWAICLLRTRWRRWVADRCILMNGCDVRNFRVLVFNSSILALLVLFVLLIHAAFSNASASPPVASTAPPYFFCCCCGAMASWMAEWRIGGWLCPAGGWWMVVGGVVSVLVCPAILRYGPKLLMQYLVLDLCVRKPLRWSCGDLPADKDAGVPCAKQSNASMQLSLYRRPRPPWLIRR